MLSLVQHLYVAPATASLKMAPISPVACAANESSCWSFVVYIFLMIWRGFLVGLGLAVVWGWNIYKRRKDRVKKASVVEPWSRVCTMPDLLKILRERAPPHISFLTYEKVEWLNKVLMKLWPYVAEATEQQAKMILQRMLDPCSGAPWISKLKLDNCHLGHVPPHIEGVRIHRDILQNSVQMDMKIKWGSGGDRIELTVTPDWRAMLAQGNFLPISRKFPVFKLSEMHFQATIRVTFHLSDEIPCISALVVTLLQEPKFKTNFTFGEIIGGTIEALPFIGDLIKDIVSSFVTDQLEWPRRVVIPIGNTPAEIRRASDLRLKLQGKLRVTVVGAEGLLDEYAICGTTKRYAQLFVRKSLQQKTEVSDGKRNPQWDEEFEFDIENQEAQTLVLKVMTQSDYIHSEELGQTTVSLCHLQPDIEYGYTRTLSRTSGTADDKLGQITFKLMYHLYDADEQANAMAAESEAFRAAREANGGLVMAAIRNLIGLSEGTLLQCLSKHVGTRVTNSAQVIAAGVHTGASRINRKIRRFRQVHELPY